MGGRENEDGVPGCKPLPAGTIGLEAHIWKDANTIYYFDDLSVCELSALSLTHCLFPRAIKESHMKTKLSLTALLIAAILLTSCGPLPSRLPL